MTAIPPRSTTKKTTKAAAPKKAAAPNATKPVKKAAAKAPAPKKAVAKKKPVAKTTPAKAAAKLAGAKKPAPAKKSGALEPSTRLAATAALCKRIEGVLDTNKGEDISVLNLTDKCSFADFMIVVSGRAPRHVSALADYVADMLKKTGTPPLSIEGQDTGDWVLIDAGDIIVHIFRPEVRQFYNIEKMWAMPAVSR